MFSDSGNRLPLFNPFAAAFATLGPAERYEAEFMGASEFLNRRLNEEFQRAFEAGILLLQFIHVLRYIILGLQVIVQHQKVFEVLYLMELHRFPSHPTSSPVSFGPSTPVQPASAAPAGLQSSPGGMSDVGSFLTPPGLLLRDPPRMAGSYGVSLNDPVLGFLREVFLVRIQVIDLYQPKLRFHLHLHNKELEIQLHSCLWGRVQ